MLPNESDALVPCPQCQQHHRLEDAQCPHCGATLPTDTPQRQGRKLGRIMYGPAPQKDAESEPREMYGPAPFQETDSPWSGSNMRAMYGPSPYVEAMPGPSLLRRVLLLLTLCGLAVLGYLLWSWRG